MVGVAQLNEFLISHNLADSISTPEKFPLQNKITRFCNFDQAQSGDAAWISSKNSKQALKNLSSFRGSFLIGPVVEMDPGHSETFVFAKCKNPRLSTLKVIEAFFSDLATIHFPNLADEKSSILSKIDSSVRLSAGVVIGSNVEIGPNCKIGPNTVLANVRIGANVEIGANCTIGLNGFGFEKDEKGIFQRFPHLGLVLIEDNVEISSNVCVDRGALSNTILRAGCKIDNLVNISHGAEIGENTIVIANSTITGGTRIGKNSRVSPSATISNKLTLGNNVVVGIGSVVKVPSPDDSVVNGNPAIVYTGISAELLKKKL